MVATELYIVGGRMAPEDREFESDDEHRPCREAIAALEREKSEILEFSEHDKRARVLLEQENARLQAELHDARVNLVSSEQDKTRLKTNGRALEHAIDRMAGAALTPRQRAADTEAVGGPVSDYCITYNEKVAADTVIARLRTLEAEVKRLRKEMSKSLRAVDSISAHAIIVDALAAEKEKP